MQRVPSLRHSISEVLITLALGAGIGGLTFAFIEFLSSIASLHTHLNAATPWHLLLIPLALLLIELVRKNTLYFPTKVFGLIEEPSSRFWTRFMGFFHYAGTLLSHLAGVSVGREGAVVLFSAGLVRALRLSWDFWGPVASSIGFAAVVGHYWIAPVFMLELFARTGLMQKIYSLLGALMALLVMQSLGGHSLFSPDPARLELSSGFFGKILILVLLAVTAGFVMRLYKTFYFYFLAQFKKFPLLGKLAVAVLLAGFFYIPVFRQFQGLGLSYFSALDVPNASMFTVTAKLFLTALSTALGFFGGEFIPLVYAGVHLGSVVFGWFGLNAYLGAALGAYLLFAGATRFKWTGYLLVLGLLGWSWWFWAYFLVMISVGFSGGLSLYKRPAL